MLRTRLTDLLGIEHPIMSAPMSMHSGGRLAAAVSLGGGAGLFGGTTSAGADWVREQIRFVKSQTDRPFGVGFITHFLPAFKQHFDIAIEERVPVIAFSFGDPQTWLPRAKDAGAVAVCQVQTLDGARQAVAAGADVLVAQGNEAGGHTGTMTLLPLLCRVIDAFPNIPVLASGGIASGRSLAAVLAAGADGAWLGTAFLATPEAVEVGDWHKERIVRSDGEDTVYTEAFDIVEAKLYGIPGWPAGIAARAQRNAFADDWQGRTEELRRRIDDIAPQYKDAILRNDPDTMQALMGQSAAFVDAVRPAADIVRAICVDAERILRERARQLVP